MPLKKQEQISTLPTFLDCMRFHLAWPKNGIDPVNPPRLFYLKFFVIVVVPCTIQLLGQAVQIGITVFSKHDDGVNMIVLFADVAQICALFALYSLSVTFMAQGRNFAEIFTEFSRFERDELPVWKDGEKTLKRYEFFTKIFYYYTISAIINTLVLTYLADDCTFESDVVTARQCGLLLKFYAPFDYTRTPWKQIILLMQIWILYVTIRLGAAIGFSTLGCTQHLIIRIKKFQMDLKQLLNEDTEAELQDFETVEWKIRFKVLIQEHIQIIDLAHRLKSCYEKTLFVHFIMASIIIGLWLFIMVKTGSFAPLFHLIGWFSNLSFPCIAGERLMSESSGVGDTIFENAKWDQHEKSIQKDLQLMILMAQKPLVLKPLSFSPFSMEFLLDVVKGAYSFSTLLQNLSQ